MLLELLPPERVAELCGVSVRTVMRAIDAGDLRASQLARRGCWRIRPEDVEAWLEARANRPRARAAAAAAGPAPAPLAGSPTIARRGGRSRRRGHGGRLLVPPPTRRDR